MLSVLAKRCRNAASAAQRFLLNIQQFLPQPLFEPCRSGLANPLIRMHEVGQKFQSQPRKVLARQRITVNIAENFAL